MNDLTITFVTEAGSTAKYPRQSKKRYKMDGQSALSVSSLLRTPKRPKRETRVGSARSTPHQTALVHQTQAPPPPTELVDPTPTPPPTARAEGSSQEDASVVAGRPRRTVRAPVRYEPVEKVTDDFSDDETDDVESDSCE